MTTTTTTTTTTTPTTSTITTQTPSPLSSWGMKNYLLLHNRRSSSVYDSTLGVLSSRRLAHRVAPIRKISAAWYLARSRWNVLVFHLLNAEWRETMDIVKCVCHLARSGCLIVKQLSSSVETDWCRCVGPTSIIIGSTYFGTICSSWVDKIVQLAIRVRTTNTFIEVLLILTRALFWCLAMKFAIHNWTGMTRM